MSIKLKLLPQETEGNSNFDGLILMTPGFRNSFDPCHHQIAEAALSLIHKTYVADASTADYLQVLLCNDIKFWIIDDGAIITLLLPNEY